MQPFWHLVPPQRSFMSSAEGVTDARAALQALIAATGPRSSTDTRAPLGVNGSRRSEPVAVANGACSDGGELPYTELPRYEAGTAMRRRFRQEFEVTLRPQKEAERLLKLDDHTHGLLEKVVPLVRGKATTALCGNRGVTSTRHAQLQTDLPKPMLVELEEDELVLDPEVERAVIPPKRITLVRKDGSQDAPELERQVEAARKQLKALDSETTTLTKQLKLCRRELWLKERDYCASERQISDCLQKNACKLSPEARDEEHRLGQQERRLTQELTEARAMAARWSSIAKRQDGMLQQEREATKGGDAQAILAKHPAGVVFLLHLPSDDSSDEGSVRSAEGRQAYTGRSRGGDVKLASSDDDSEDFVPPARGGVSGSGGVGRGAATGGSASRRPPPQDSDDEQEVSHAPPPPPRPAQQWRAPLLATDRDDSDGMDATSPSDNGFGGRRQRHGDDSESDDAGSMLRRPKNRDAAPARASRLSYGGGVTGPRLADSPSSNESTSDEEISERQGRATPTLEGLARLKLLQSRQGEAAASVPPLPQLAGRSGLAIDGRGRPNVGDDSNSSEDGLDQYHGTSRSA